MEPFIAIPMGIATVVLLLWAILTFVPYRKYTHEHIIEARKERSDHAALIAIFGIVAFFLFIMTLGGEDV